MKPANNLITVRGIKKIPECQKMPRQFVDYLRDVGLITGTRVTIIKREVWKYTPREAALIQSVWYFRNKGFDFAKSIELAHKTQNRRDLKLTEPHLFSEIGS